MATSHGPADKLEIVHLLSFQRTKLNDAVLSPGKLGGNCPLDYQRTLQTPPTSTHKTPPAGLGFLQTRFPQEILNEILLFLDLTTLLTFRRANTAALQAVNALPEYRATNTHIPGVIRAYIATGLSSFVNMHELYSALISPVCAYCNSFGAFVFLPECKRVCWGCHTQNPELLPICRGLAAVSFGVSPEALVGIATLTPVQGPYTLHSTCCNFAHNPTPLVSRAAVRRVAIKVHGSDNAVNAFVRMHYESQLSSCRIQKAVFNDFRSATPESPNRDPGQPVYYSDRDNKDDDVRRFQGVATMPVLNPKTGELEHGVCCVGCDVAFSKAPTVAHCIPNGRVDWLKRKHMMFGEANGFMEHFGQCVHAKSIWEAWKGKGVKVPAPEGYGAQYGGDIEIYAQILGMLQAQIVGAMAVGEGGAVVGNTLGVGGGVAE